jgi:hypothetical protein
MYAKLFDNAQYEQILIKLDSDDDGKPEVRIYFAPDGLGVCSIAISFSDDSEGWEKAEKSFNLIDNEKAVKMVDGALKGLPIEELSQ